MYCLCNTMLGFSVFKFSISQFDIFGYLITMVVGKYNELSDQGHMLVLLDAMTSSWAAMVEGRTGMASHETKME